MSGNSYIIILCIQQKAIFVVYYMKKRGVYYKLMQIITILICEEKLQESKKALLTAMITQLQALNYHIKTLTIPFNNEGRNRLQQLCLEKTIKCLAIAGGDGFLHFVLQTWHDPNIPIAVIPLGTCNLFARECGYTKNPAKIVHIIHQGRTKNFYCGKANKTIFMTVASCGLDSYTCQAVDYSKKRIFGRAYFTYLLLKTLFRSRPNLQISINQQNPIEVSTVLVLNSHYYAGPFCITPQASLFSPQLFIMFYKKQSLWNECKITVAVFTNRLHKLANVTIMPVNEVEIISPRGAPVQLDGDVCMHASCKVTIDNQIRLVYVL